MGELMKAIADGIYQLQLPLPFALRIVNCYLLQGERGWTIIDTGVNTPAGRECWQEALASLGPAVPQLERIIITHSHPDHLGLAGWLQTLSATRQSNPAPVFMSPKEIAIAKIFWEHPTEILDRFHRLFVACGVPTQVLGTALLEAHRLLEITQPKPQQILPLDYKKIVVGKRALHIIHAPGHSDGQVILHDAKEHLVFCGDHVLQEITPNISLWPMTEPDPLGRYLCSLAELRSLGEVSGLPGHGPIITNWQKRMHEITSHHAARLQRMLAATEDGVTVYEVAAQEFEIEALSAYEIRFAVAETLAHLEYLVRQDAIRRSENKVWKYELIRER